MDHKKKAKNRSGNTHTLTNSFPQPMCLSKQTAALTAVLWCWHVCATFVCLPLFLGNRKPSSVMSETDHLVSEQCWQCMNQQLLNDLPFKTTQQAQDFKPRQHNTRPSLHQHHLCNLSAALTITDSQQIMYVFLFLTFDRHVAFTCGVYRRTEWRQLDWRDGMWGETSFITQCFDIPWYGWVRISQAAVHTPLTPSQKWGSCATGALFTEQEKLVEKQKYLIYVFIFLLTSKPELTLIK